MLYEGFDCEEYNSYDSDLRANVLRILNDTESHIHYNLHGSAFWEVYDLDKEQLPNPEIVLTAAPNLQCNNNPASIQIEKGKTLLVTNIVTGYQKAQKAMLTPIKQMQFSFDRDCCFADELFVIGYSFGDEHINGSIKTAIRYNPKLKIRIIDPYFIKNEMEYFFALNFFPFRNDGIEALKPKKIADNEYQFFGGAFTAYTLGFKEYLHLKGKNI